MKRVCKQLFLLLAALTLAFSTVLAEQADAPPAAEQTQELLPDVTPEPPVQPTEAPEPTAAAQPQVRFTRDFSGSFAEYGEKITLSYTVRNEGVLPITNVIVTDGLVGEVGRIERLESGEKKTMSVRVRITESCTSTPGISYECGGIQYSERRGAERIYLAKVDVRVELSADKTNVAPGEMVTLRLNVTNEGNVNLYGLRASEPVLGDLGSIVSALPPGDECVITRTVQMKSANTFQFSITGSSDTGGAISVQSNEMSVLVTPVAAQILLSLRAQADRTTLEEPGEVSFSLYLTNECALELRNVSLSEETRGKIRDLVFVPTGEMPVITETYSVSESGVYRFQAQVTDSVGDRLTVYSEPIEISVMKETQSAIGTTQPQATSRSEENAIPVLDGSPYRMEENPATFEKLMFGTAVILLTGLIIWYAVSVIQKGVERRRRARRRKQKRNKKRARAKGKK